MPTAVNPCALSVLPQALRGQSWKLRPLPVAMRAPLAICTPTPTLTLNQISNSIPNSKPNPNPESYPLQLQTILHVCRCTQRNATRHP